MNIIKIAEVNIVESKKDTFTYESLMSLALNTIKYKRLNNAKQLIDKELRDNGFKPLKKSKSKAKQNNATTNRKVVRKGNVSQPEEGSKPSTE
jgi:hypothetical protein